MATCPGLNQTESEPGCLLAPGPGRGSSPFDPHYPSPSWPKHPPGGTYLSPSNPVVPEHFPRRDPPSGLAPRSPKGAPCDGAPGHPRRGGPFPGGGGAAAVRTRRRPGRVGKRGEGRAPRAGRSWERPPPRPAFERATQGAGRRFKSKRPPARLPSRAQAWGEGALGDPARSGPRQWEVGARGAPPSLVCWVGGPCPPGAAGEGVVGASEAEAG